MRLTSEFNVPLPCGRLACHRGIKIVVSDFCPGPDQEELLRVNS